jgi:hypothetical protein
MPFDANPIREVETKPEPFTLDSLIGWLETKNPTETYCWMKTGKCLFALYGEFVTGVSRNAGAYALAVEGFWKVPIHEILERRLGEPLCGVASLSPHTFGAALTRARALRASKGA